MQTPPAACSNCSHPLPGQARFCPQCSQRTRYGPRSLREAVQEVVGRDYSPDGRLWLTLRRLFVPGALTADWFAGRQQRYLGPMRLLLLLLLLAVLSLQMLFRTVAPAAGAGAWRFDYGPASSERAPLVDQKLGAVQVRVHGGWLSAPLQPWAAHAQQALGRMTEAELRLRVQTVTLPARWHALVLVQLPVLMLALALVHLGQGRRAAEHAVWTLHFAAFALVAVMLLAPLELLAEPVPAVALLGLAVALWFTLALRRFYGGAWWAVLLRSAFVLGVLVLPLPYLDVLVALATLS